MRCTYKLDRSLCNNAAAKRASRRIGLFYDEVLAPCGIRATQHALLQQIPRLGSSSLTDLSVAMVVDRSALSHTVRPLERDGLLTLHSEDSDRRIRLVRLTEAGRAKLDECTPFWEKAQKRFEAVFGYEEAAALRKELDTVAALDFASRREMARAGKNEAGSKSSRLSRRSDQPSTEDGAQRT